MSGQHVIALRTTLLGGMLLLLSLMSGGCSLAIAEGGKDVSFALDNGAARIGIEEMIGPPVREEKAGSLSFPSPLQSNEALTTATNFAEYRYVGRADDLEQFQDLGMLVGLTLGFGEIVAFPMALKRSHDLGKNVHEYRVWYDASSKCIAHEKRHSGWGTLDKEFQ